MEKVGVFLAAGYEEIEALTVVDVLRRADIETDIIAITEEKEVTGAHGMVVKADKTLAATDFTQLNMIVLPGGGLGTKNLEACEKLTEQLDLFFRAGKDIAAICAAPSILGHRGMLQGKRACCYPDFESHLTGAAVVREEAVTDGHIITGRGMGCAIAFALAIVTHYQGKAAADSLAEKIIYSR